MINKAIKVSLLSLMISGAAMASSSLAPLGALQAGDNVTIQNELGTFPVSGSYSVMAGDQIKTGTGGMATLAIDGGHLYFSANSSATVSGSDGNYFVVLTSGSIGYKLRSQSTLKVVVAGEGATPVAVDGLASGAVAVNSNGSLIVSPMIGNMIAVSSDGTVTTVEQGYTWMNTSDGAKLILTQVLETAAISSGWTAVSVATVVAAVAGVAAVVSVASDDCGRSCS